MGCDIHIHSEIKVNGKWLHYDQPNCERDYDLFEKMAGVRGDIKNAIAPPRGIPDDATETTKLCCEYDGVDGHSHSWLSSKEIAELSEWADNNDRPWTKNEWDKWLFGNGYSDFHKYLSARPKFLEDVRFIFWFDN